MCVICSANFVGSVFGGHPFYKPIIESRKIITPK